MIAIDEIVGFDWDEHNVDKNWIKHQVRFTECEEVFFNDPIIIYEDKIHSINKLRYYCLGRTNNNRSLFIVFTLRNKLIRVISARDMNNKEKKEYEKHT